MPRSRRESIAGRCMAFPYGVKDLLDTNGIATTYGAEPFRNRVPAADSAVVRALERCRRRADRQALARRARAQRHLVRRPDDEPVAARGRRIGIERRARRRHGGGARRVLHRQRNRRQHRLAGDAMWCHRPAPDVRPRAAHWRHDALLVARQARADDATVEDAMLVLQAISGPDPGDPSSVPSHLDFDADAPTRRTQGRLHRHSG